MTKGYLVKALKRLYAELAGEKLQLETPHSARRLRLHREREAYEAAADDRARRIATIAATLPHVAAVVRLFEHDWQPEDTPPIRPKKERSSPRGGFASAALDVLRNAESPMTISEIAGAISLIKDLSYETVEERERLCVAVRNALKNRSYSEFLIRDGSKPVRWSLRRTAIDAAE